MTDVPSLATRIRQAIAAGRLKAPETARVEALAPQVQRVLDALGHPEAVVTDASAVGSLLLTAVDPEGVLAEASEKLGVEVSEEDHVWQVAERLLGPGDVE